MVGGISIRIIPIDKTIEAAEEFILPSQTVEAISLKEGLRRVFVMPPKLRDV